MSNKLNISVTKNEFFFYPDIANNLELPEKDRFTIVLQRKSYLLHSQEWFEKITTPEGDKVRLNHADYIRAHFVRFINPLGVDMSGGKGEDIQDLTLDMLLTRNFSEFQELIEDLFVEVGRINKVDTEIKK